MGTSHGHTIWLGIAAVFLCRVLPTVSGAFCAKGATGTVLALLVFQRAL